MIYLISFHLLFWSMFLQSLVFSFFLNENFFSLFFVILWSSPTELVLNHTLYWEIFYTGSIPKWYEKLDPWNTVLPAFVPKNSPPPSLGKGEALEFSVAVLEVDFSVQALLNEQTISQGLLSSVSFLLFHYSPCLPSEFKFLATLTV